MKAHTAQSLIQKRLEQTRTKSGGGPLGVWQAFARKHKLDWADLALVVILSLGIFLRIWKLESHMILISDSGRDMIAAVQGIETRSPPLLGIPSSIPRFRQGPLSIWFLMLIFLVTGPNPLMAGYMYVSINIIALVLCYWLVSKTVNVKAGLYSALLLACSPLAVAHSRMPYHITPIILFLLIYLVSLKNLGEKKKNSLFFACFTWALLFQFELALFPLLLLIPWTLFSTKGLKSLSKKSILSVFGGLGLGLIPQIIFDFTHSFAQLGGFAVWIVYRFAAFLGYKGDHTFSLSRLVESFSLFISYFSRIFSYDHRSTGIFVFGILVIVIAYNLRFILNKPLLIQQTTVGLILLLLAFVIHGSPSEAYFPPIILLSVIVLGSFLGRLKTPIQVIGVGILIGLCTYNSYEIVSHNFFTRPNASVFEYGASYSEKVQVMNWIIQSSAGTSFTIRSTDPDAHFETYLDDYKIIYLSLTKRKISDSMDHSTVYFINRKNSDLLSIPGGKVTFFPSLDVIEAPLQ